MAAETFDSAWTIIGRTHFDSALHGADWPALRARLRPRAEAATSVAELRGVLGELIGALHESHFAILPGEVVDGAAAAARGTGGRAARAAERDASDGPPGDVGLEIRFVEGVPTITTVERNSPAARAGVHPGWVVSTIAGCPVSAITRRVPATLDARARTLRSTLGINAALAGPAGGRVAATFTDGAGHTRSVTLVRRPAPGAAIKFGNLPTLIARLTSAETRTPGGRRVGVIRFNLWLAPLMASLDSAIDRSRGDDAIVLDLRGNVGGVGGMVAGVGGHFLDSAVSLGTSHTRTTALRFVTNPRRVSPAGRRVAPFAGPLVILVDGLSASTSEVFAGGMRDVGRAYVVGDTTAGEALPAVSERLPNGDYLYHAIADFILPGGASLEGPGVAPQQVVRVTRSALLAGRDPALDAALRWVDSTPPPRHASDSPASPSTSPANAPRPR